MAGLKVLVRAVCVLAALGALGLSFWASVSFTANGHDLMTGTDGPLTRVLRAIAAAPLTGYQQLALAVVTSIGVAVMVASRAARAALLARYLRRVIGAESLLLLYGLAFVLQARGPRWNGLQITLDAILGAAPWFFAVAIALAIVYLLWRTLAERVLTLRHIGGALLASAAFGVAWVTLLRAAGVQIAEMPTTDATWMMSPMLLPLMASVVAPWSLNRIRHT
jgi:hypothetical protein